METCGDGVAGHYLILVQTMILTPIQFLSNATTASKAFPFVAWLSLQLPIVRIFVGVAWVDSFLTWRGRVQRANCWQAVLHSDVTFCLLVLVPNFPTSSILLKACHLFVSRAFPWQNKRAWHSTRTAICGRGARGDQHLVWFVLASQPLVIIVAILTH